MTISTPVPFSPHAVGWPDPGTLRALPTEERLAVHGYQDIALLNAAYESQHFALPRELRRSTARRP